MEHLNRKTALDNTLNFYRMVDKTAENARDLELELNWFREILETKLQSYFAGEKAEQDIYTVEPPDFSKSESFYGKFATRCELTFAERLVVLLSHISHIRPNFLNE